MSSFHPLNDWVLVQVDPQPKENVSRGGILLVEDKKNKVLTGTVLALGPGKMVAGNRVPIGVELGEKVAFFSTNFETSAGESIQEVLGRLEGQGVGLVRADSILFAFVAESVSIEV